MSFLTAARAFQASCDDLQDDCDYDACVAADGDAYKANCKCARATSQSKCSFLVTDEYTDCEMTTTETPATTEEAGC
jgi:hypothetical protein